MLEHPAITYYNRYGYLPDQQEEHTPEKIGRCFYCDESIYEDDNTVVLWEGHYFCDKDCLVDAHSENLLPNHE